jgi:hypothetical protein
LAIILNWPTLTKNGNNAFSHGNSHFSSSHAIVNHPKHVPALPEKYEKFDF